MINHEREDTNDELVVQDPEQDSLLDLSTESWGTWDPPDQMYAFLEKYFNCSLLEVERQAIAQDYPKLNCPALEVPRFDEEVRQQLK